MLRLIKVCENETLNGFCINSVVVLLDLELWEIHMSLHYFHILKKRILYLWYALEVVIHKMDVLNI